MVPKDVRISEFCGTTWELTGFWPNGPLLFPTAPGASARTPSQLSCQQTHLHLCLRARSGWRSLCVSGVGGECPRGSPQLLPGKVSSFSTPGWYFYSGPQNSREGLRTDRYPAALSSNLPRHFSLAIFPSVSVLIFSYSSPLVRKRLLP